ncbi:hypothetical protein ABB30_13865 [Stenotrophomonas ginsengisoli]|uniref:TonB-dependent receptor n=1 Tax=Stenotrophomonas ginsengisoli TaxID=336566 RepID=A0A0R0D8L4_9GAMM|nr:hypothetical protein ABB30_13865 [Stenotrophomonas ginsengisoli]
MAQERASTEDEPTADQAQTLDTIVVTGSRIRREAGFDGPAPMSTIDAAAITASGHTQITDVVNQLPGFAITQTGQTSNQYEVGNPGINALDLRGMGVQRTLTLVDSRRQVPSIPGTSGVDLSMIPSSLVERVEVITGGASALYGADAVNGVANFILKRDFDGLEANIRYGNSSRFDMPSTTADVLFGKNFADNRGNFTLFGFAERTSGEVSGQDRPWTAGGMPLYERANAGDRRVITEGNRNFYNSPNAQVVLGNCNSSNWMNCLYTFDANGQLRRPQLGPGGLVNLNPGALNTGNALLQQGRTDGGEYGAYYDNWMLSVPSDRQTVRSTVNFDFNEHARFFANLTYSQSQTQTRNRELAAYGSGYEESVPYDSPFITQDMIDANGGAFTDNISFARHFDNDFGLRRTDYERKLLQVVTGLEGDFELFSRNWNYSGYVSYGRSEERSRSLNAAALPRFYAGLNSTADANGNAVCNGSWVWSDVLNDWDWAAPMAGCVAINPFAQLTPEMVKWLSYDTDWSKTQMTQKVASAYASGGLFDLPGGEAQLVVGMEYRSESNNVGVSPQFNANHALFDPSLGYTATPLIGEYSVKEAFGEIHLPLISGAPGAERLSLDLAGRVSDYNLSGRTTTTKVGLEWAPIEDLTLRGTYGKAIRAPNIGEMFTAGVVSGAWLYDPCNDYSLANSTGNTQYTAANCAQIAPSDTATYWQWLDVIYSGNTELGPETAKTTTFGAVFRPRFINNLVISADYYKIDLRNVIAGLAPQTILQRCVDLASMDNQFCGLVTRNATGDLVDVSVQQLNLAQSLARGVDINATWFTQLPRGHRLSLDLNLGRNLERIDIADAANPDDVWNNLEIFGTPQWKGSLRTGLSHEKYSVYWTLRGYSKMRASEYATYETYERPWSGSMFYNDIYASYQLTPKVSVSAGMNNMFDRSPPRIPGAEAGGSNFNQGIAGTSSGLYDVIGRTFHLSLNFKL